MAAYGSLQPCDPKASTSVLASGPRIGGAGLGRVPGRDLIASEFDPQPFRAIRRILKLIPVFPEQPGVIPDLRLLCEVVETKLWA